MVTTMFISAGVLILVALVMFLIMRGRAKPIPPASTDARIQHRPRTSGGDD